MVMFAKIDYMATKHDKTALVEALAGLAETHPNLAEQLGSDPTRADLLEVIGDLAPGVAAGARSMSRAALVALLTAIAPEPEPDEMVGFTTRLPEGLRDEVTARAHARGVYVQTLVAEYLRAGLAADTDEA